MHDHWVQQKPCATKCANKNPVLLNVLCMITGCNKNPVLLNVLQSSKCATTLKLGDDPSDDICAAHSSSIDA